MEEGLVGRLFRVNRGFGTGSSSIDLFLETRILISLSIAAIVWSELPSIEHSDSHRLTNIPDIQGMTDSLFLQTIGVYPLKQDSRLFLT